MPDLNQIDATIHGRHQARSRSESSGDMNNCHGPGSKVPESRPQNGFHPSSAKSFDDTLRRGWQSDRLLYRAFEDNDEDSAFYYETMTGDPAVFASAYLDCSSGEESGLEDGTHPALTDVTKSKKPTPAPTRVGLITLSIPEAEYQQHRTTVLSIMIADRYQNLGYGPEAINWALDWAFRFGNMHRVELFCYGHNKRAARVYERLGFVKEGALRQCIWFNRTWHDKICFGMLESDWEALRAHQQQE